jgi:hypothetical protein
MNDDPSRNDDLLPPPDGFAPRRRRRNTNWLYRVDSLRPIHIWEAGQLFDNAESLMVSAVLLFVVAQQFVMMGAHFARQQISASAKMASSLGFFAALMSTLFWSEAWCYYYDFLDIVYYPLTNRVPDGSRFHPVRNSTIDELTEPQAEAFTGFNKDQLQRLRNVLRLHEDIPTTGYERPRFTAEELLLYFLYFLRTGHTYLQMSSESVFGGVAHV